MLRTSKKCRICGEETFKRMKPIQVAPFFCFYGLQIANGHEVPVALYSGFCTHCLFLSMWQELSDDCLRDYYEDYASNAYKKSRVTFEPWFNEIKDSWISDDELLLRRREYRQWIDPRLTKLLPNNPRILDFGGGGGGRNSWY